MDLEPYLLSASQGHARVIPGTNVSLAPPELTLKCANGALFFWLMKLLGRRSLFDILIRLWSRTHSNRCRACLCSASLPEDSLLISSKPKNDLLKNRAVLLTSEWTDPAGASQKWRSWFRHSTFLPSSLLTWCCGPQKCFSIPSRVPPAWKQVRVIYNSPRISSVQLSDTEEYVFMFVPSS